MKAITLIVEWKCDKCSFAFKEERPRFTVIEGARETVESESYDKPPRDWMTLWQTIGGDSGRIRSLCAVLCPSCRQEFQTFMRT